MNRDDALHLVESMYHANGREPATKVAAALATEVARSSCPACAKQVVRRSLYDGPILTVPSFRSAYAREFASPNHALHIGQDERQVDVGKVEADWRTKAVRALVSNGMALDRAEVAAAMAWASESCDVEDFDADVEVWTRHTPKTITPALVEAAWTYARAIAMTPPRLMTDAEWNERVGAWRAVWRASV